VVRSAGGLLRCFGLQDGIEMALTTAQDLATLNSWSLLTDYTSNKTEFVAVGKIVYQALTGHGGSPPSGPNDLEQPLTLALQVTNIFKMVCTAKQHARPILYDLFALSLARYILDNEWTEVTKP